MFASDFIQYWTAFQLATAGQNPYDAPTLLAAQQLIRPEATIPLMMWNPPWILLLLGPVLLFSFQASALVWVGLNTTVLAVFAYRAKVVVSTKATVLTLLLITAFYPVWSCLSLGQMSLLLLAGTLLVLRGVLAGRLVPIAFGAVLLSLKPHLFFFLGVVLLSRLARHRWYAPVIAAVGGVTFAAALSEIIFPGLISNWIEALQNPGKGAVPPPAFAVTTLVGVIRGALKDSEGMIPVWPMKVVPLLPAVAFLVWQLRAKKMFPLERLWPGVLAFSYLFSPYGWTFDICLLLPAWVVSQSELLSRRRNLVGSIVMMIGFGAQAAAFILPYIPGLVLFQVSYWWLPVFITLGWCYSELTKPSTESALGGSL